MTLHFEEKFTTASSAQQLSKIQHLLKVHIFFLKFGILIISIQMLPHHANISIIVTETLYLMEF